MRNRPHHELPAFLWGLAAATIPVLPVIACHVIETIKDAKTTKGGKNEKG